MERLGDERHPNRAEEKERIPFKKPFSGTTS
jgi:hypothetical protein